MDQMSGLAFLEVSDKDPLKLFRDWKQEARDAGCSFVHTNCMCLATSTRNGKVSNRTVMLKELDDNGFVFVTDGRGRKIQDIKENPEIAATFLWIYAKDKRSIVRQVRIEGKAHEIDTNRLQRLFDAESFQFKIRDILCHQDQEVEWEDLKKQHDEFLADVLSNKKTLERPEYYVGYQIVPERMDFYYTWDNCIADRVVFTLSENEWKFVHVAA